eukprot:TRINITY_DN52384_c0_g2_i3.p2 TRINITY_DN52384_c0_g2~~TRINITY_DN52384_c0_g2_i3.p2  ORF type:complete len:133 (+),score=2.01 TRINITY_DN52384_c0_g2_i3:167-565(+)
MQFATVKTKFSYSAYPSRPIRSQRTRLFVGPILDARAREIPSGMRIIVDYFLENRQMDVNAKPDWSLAQLQQSIRDRFGLNFSPEHVSILKHDQGPLLPNAGTIGEQGVTDGSYLTFTRSAHGGLRLKARFD